MHHLPSRYIPCDGRLTASAYFLTTLPAGGATWRRGFCLHQIPISIHAPRRGSDVPASQGLSGLQAFQSTLPAWGATTNDVFEYELSLDFNPRSPWGERQAANLRHLILMIISIHAPRGGRHIGLPVTTLRAMAFQSTLPVGGSDRPLFFK